MNLLIFDLDGTLIDSKLDLAHSVNAARNLMGLPNISMNWFLPMSATALQCSCAGFGS